MLVERLLSTQRMQFGCNSFADLWRRLSVGRWMMDMRTLHPRIPRYREGYAVASLDPSYPCCTLAEAYTAPMTKGRHVSLLKRRVTCLLPQTLLLIFESAPSSIHSFVVEDGPAHAHRLCQPLEYQAPSSQGSEPTYHRRFLRNMVWSLQGKLPINA